MINPLMLMALRNLPRNAPMAGAMGATSVPEPQPWMPDSAQRPMVAPPGTAPSGMPAPGSAMPGSEDRAKADQALARANSIQDPKRGRISSGEALIAGLVAALAGAAGARNAIPSLQNYLGTKQGLLDQEYGDAQKQTEAQRQSELAKYQAAMDAWRENNRLAEQKTDNERQDAYYKAQIDNWNRTGTRLEGAQETRTSQADLRILQGFADRMPIDPRDPAAVQAKFKALKEIAGDDVPDETIIAMSQPSGKDWLAETRKFNVEQMLPQVLKLKKEDLKKRTAEIIGIEKANKIKDKQYEKLEKELSWFDRDRAFRQAHLLAWERISLGNLALRARGQDRMFLQDEANVVKDRFGKIKTVIQGELTQLNSEKLKLEKEAFNFQASLLNMGENDPAREAQVKTLDLIKARLQDLEKRIEAGKTSLDETSAEETRLLTEGTKRLKDYESYGDLSSAGVIGKAGKAGPQAPMEGNFDPSAPPIPLKPTGLNIEPAETPAQRAARELAEKVAGAMKGKGGKKSKPGQRLPEGYFKGGG